MEMHPGIKIIDLALYLRKYKTLIVSDFQIGYEESLNKQGILIPRFQYQDIIKRLNLIFKEVKPEKIVVNGDLKHEFGNISEQEWRHVLKLIDYLSNKCKELILIKGNHDLVLGPIAKKRNIEVKEYYKLGDISILHGDKIIKETLSSKILVIGHEHPAVSFRDVRTEKYKCFLKGKWKNKILIIQPSFNLINEGSDVLKEKMLSPFLQNNIKNFNVYVIQDKVYDFGLLKDLIN